MMNAERTFNGYKLLPLLSMSYMAVALLSTLFVYKIVLVGPTIITAGALLSPLWYFIADIITEVYGFRIARNIIWAELFLEFFFVSVAYLFLTLPSPAYWSGHESYNFVFSNLPRVFIGSLVGTIVGAFINTTLVSKWKVLLKGRAFWLRSLGANAIGQLVFSFLTSFIDLYKVIPLHEILKEASTSYIIKLSSFSLLIIPVAVAAEVIKKIEHIDTYDTNIKYNPFKIVSSGT